MIEKVNYSRDRSNLIIRVATVINYFIKWMKEFPTIEDLAKAAPERVNEMWAGLGYYRRAKFLQQCAKAVVEKHNGIIPKTAKELETLPGIGKYTAGAVASIAFGEVTPIVGKYSALTINSGIF